MGAPDQRQIPVAERCAWRVTLLAGDEQHPDIGKPHVQFRLELDRLFRTALQSASPTASVSRNALAKYLDKEIHVGKCRQSRVFGFQDWAKGFEKAEPAIGDGDLEEVSFL